MIKKNLPALFLLLCLTISLCLNAKNNYIKPNVILIYADDLGRGMLGTYGQKVISTPNIDKLAEGGITFSNAYGCHLCAPARASIITGKHDCHKNAWTITKAGIYTKLDVSMSLEEIENSINKVSAPAKENEVFLGQVAQKAGYKTAEFGKLEWGFATTNERLKRHGWDYHFGYYDHTMCHGFYPPFLFENGKKIPIEGNTRVDCGKTKENNSEEAYKERWNMEGKKIYSQNIIMDKLLDYISQNRDNPFFIYFPTQLPHGPVAIPEVHPDFINNNRLSELEKEYASMVKMLDDDVGRIISLLEELKLRDNTLIIFTSDNGHELYYGNKGRMKRESLEGIKYDDISTKYTSKASGDVFDGNDGMSGLKRSNWEGGVKVPLIYNWPAKISSHKTNQLVANYDLLPTIADLLKSEIPKGIDGTSYLNILKGGQTTEKDYVVHASFMGPALVTADGWKIRYYLKKDVFQLYYLPEDYEENNNLADLNSDKLEALKALLVKECEGDLNNGYFLNSSLKIPQQPVGSNY